MKTLFQNSIVLFFVTLFSINASFGQFKESPITEADLAPQVSAAGVSVSGSNDKTVLTNHFTQSGYKAAGLNQEGSTKFTGTDAQGAFVLSIITTQMKKGASVVDVTEVTLTRGNKVEKTSFAEENGKAFKVSNNAVRSTSAATGEVGVSSLSSCAAQFIGSTTAAALKCISAVNSCVSSKSRWYAKIICTVKCVPPCLVCMGGSVSRIIAFVRCVIG